MNCKRSSSQPFVACAIILAAVVLGICTLLPALPAVPFWDALLPSLPSLNPALGACSAFLLVLLAAVALHRRQGETDNDLTTALAEVRRLEQSLWNKEELVRRLTASMTDCCLILLDAEGCVAEWNTGAQKLHGYPPAQMLGRHFGCLLAGGDQERFDPEQALGLAASQGQLEEEAWCTRPDGAPFWGKLTLQSLRDAKGQLRGFACLTHDLTAQRRLESKLRKSSGRTTQLLKVGQDVFFTLGAEGTFRFLNPAFETITGWPHQEWLGKPYGDWIGNAAATAAQRFFEKLLKGEASPGVELEVRTKSGTTIPMQFSARPCRDGCAQGCFGIARDLTDRKKLELTLRQTEEQLHQAQKMEILGSLAGGVAHDFNNLLTVIIGCSDILLKTREGQAPLKTIIEEIRKAGERGAALTQQLLAFSRREPAPSKLVNLNSVIINMDNVVRRLIGENIRLSTTPGPELGWVKADSMKLEQVIMNLVVNARDAMPKGGRLTLLTSNVHLDVSYAREHPEVRPGAYVMVAVQDTGHGMSAEVKARIFEPFFTTKEKGKGTGLGLATVYGIIKQYDGHLEVDSAPGRGTIFKAYLPRAKEPPPEEQAVAEPFMPVRGTETVLLVEDEDNVRLMAGQSLVMNGYTVLPARSGEEALSLCKQHDGPIHILVSDVVMPGMDGRRLAQRLRELYPDLKVLYISGYSDSVLLDHGVEKVTCDFIRKPFSPEILAWKVREQLDGNKVPTAACAGSARA